MGCLGNIKCDQYKLGVTDLYLIRRMTGVGGRPEVIIEGSDAIHGPWQEYQFLHKPGNVSRAPSYVLPHQPRLDWQMWFAALGSYQHNPWLLGLVFRLLEGREEVVDLLDPASPFTMGPGAVGAPINIGGQRVETGDMIVADRDGVVVVPYDKIDEVIESLERVKTLEAELDAKVAAGQRTAGAIDELLKSDRVRFVD